MTCTVRQPCPPCTSYGQLPTCSRTRSRGGGTVRPPSPVQAAPSSATMSGRNVASAPLLRCLSQWHRHRIMPPWQSSSSAASSLPLQQEQEVQVQPGADAPAAAAGPTNGSSTEPGDMPQPTSTPGEPDASALQPAKSTAKKAQEFANRVIFGLVLGLAAAFVILYARLALLAVALLVTYQATQEYYGFITSKQMSAGMTPPPPFVSAATTVMVTSMALLSYFHQGKSGTVLAVASFLLLVMNVLALKRPKFSQLASSLFGLFYCGAVLASASPLPAPAPSPPEPVCMHSCQLKRCHA